MESEVSYGEMDQTMDFESPSSYNNLCQKCYNLLMANEYNKYNPHKDYKTTKVTKSTQSSQTDMQTVPQPVLIKKSNIGDDIMKLLTYEEIINYVHTVVDNMNSKYKKLQEELLEAEKLIATLDENILKKNAEITSLRTPNE
jgi:hypothetical protein